MASLLALGPFADAEVGVCALNLVILVLSAGFAGRVGRPGAVVLVIASLVWPLLNHPMEGVVIVTVHGSHGITAGDCATPAGLLVAAVAWATAPGARQVDVLAPLDDL